MVSTLSHGSGKAIVRAATVVAMCVVLLVVESTNAHAVEGEWTVGGGAVLSSIPTEEVGIVGFGGTAFVRYKFTDSIGISLGGLYSYHLSRPAVEPDEDDQPAIQVGIPKLGFLYVLDVIDLVPYFLVEATAYF